MYAGAFQDTLVQGTDLENRLLFYVATLVPAK